MKTLSLTAFLSFIILSYSFSQSPRYSPYPQIAGKTSHVLHTQSKRINQSVYGQRSFPLKSINYSWDKGSGTWIKESITHYSYTTAGLVSEEMTTDTSGLKLESMIYTYDSKGHMLEYLVREWNGSAWFPVGGHRDTYTYTNGQVTEVLSEVYYENNGWDPLTKEIRTLDTNGFVKQIEASSPDLFTGEWEVYVTINYMNDAKGWPVSTIGSALYGSVWEEFKNLDITWNSFDQDIMSGEWLTVRDQEWNGSEWIDTERKTVAWNSGMTIFTEKHTGSAWVNYSRETFVTDHNKNPELYTREAWENASWTIKSGSDYLLTYDPSDNLLSMIIQYYDPMSQTYKNTYKYVYSDFLQLGVNQELLNNALQVYPNPAKDRLTLDLSSNKAEKLFIYNSLGQEVYTLNLTSETLQIDVSALAPGLYILKASGEKGTYTGKFIKE